MPIQNTEPFEIVAAPFTLYIADVGTAFPEVDEEPGVSWTKVGSSGDLNYDDATGVVVEHSQEISEFRALGDAGTRKVFRTGEAQKVRMKLVDVTLEQYRLALNRNTVTATAAGVGTPGTKKLGLSRGFQVDTMALLVRGPVSAYGVGQCQYEIPVAAQTGNPTVVWKKGEPAGLDLEWTTLVDPDAASEDERFGRLVVQTDEAAT